MSTTTPSSPYVILLRQPAGGVPAPDELKQILAQFGAWIDDLAAKGLLQASNPLELGGKVLRGRRGASVTDGPYAETKEVVGGLVLINAPNLEAAVEAARGCPGLDYAMTVEVRPVGARRRP